jgi:hypothetical protein
MSWRFDPRPEIVSLFCLACFLTVLWHAAEGKPVLLWLLPLVQAVWVNVQGLFILGPVVTIMFVLDQYHRRRRHEPCLCGPRLWLPVAAIGLACLATPYGLAALRFPFDLLPKVAQAGNPYKEYIDELTSPATLVHEGNAYLAGNWYLGALHWLLLMLPASFLLPAFWPADSRARSRWAALLVLAALLTTTMLRHGPGDWIPIVLVALTIIATASLGSRAGHVFPFTPLPEGEGLKHSSRPGGEGLGRQPRPGGAIRLLIAGIALAAWCAGLRMAFLQPASLPFQLSAPAILAVAAMAMVLVFATGSSALFSLLLAAGFGFLALQAIQNAGRFALVAGCVLVWNLGPWLAAGVRGQSSEVRSQRSEASEAWLARIGMAGFLLLWLGALLSDRYQRWTGEPRHLSLHEEPLEFAHDAVLFAGQPELPGRALLYDLGQTGLYDFYHGPERKPFMDGRLEMPALETFRTYVNIETWLEHGDPRWRHAIHELGDPVVILTHLQHFGGEGVLINNPDWTCAYFDALAAVFVPRSSRCLTIDFARRHFEEPEAPSVPRVRGSAFRELRALYNLAIASRPDPGTAWTLRMPLLLHALDRGAIAIREEPDRSGNWVLLGDCHRAMAEILNREHAGDAGDSLSLVWLARARFAYEQAIRIDGHDATARRSLKELDIVYRRAVEHLSRPMSSITSPASGKEASEGVEQIIGTAGPDCRRGITDWLQYRSAEARQAFSRAVESSPRDGNSWYLVAWLEAEEGNGPRALDACRHALECVQSPGRQRVLRTLEELVTRATSARHTLQADGRERG